jgi:hypothetical protein
LEQEQEGTTEEVTKDEDLSLVSSGPLDGSNITYGHDMVPISRQDCTNLCLFPTVVEFAIVFWPQPEGPSPPTDLFHQLFFPPTFFHSFPQHFFPTAKNNSRRLYHVCNFISLFDNLPFSSHALTNLDG